LFKEEIRVSTKTVIFIANFTVMFRYRLILFMYRCCSDLDFSTPETLHGVV